MIMVISTTIVFIAVEYFLGIKQLGGFIIR